MEKRNDQDRILKEQARNNKKRDIFCKEETIRKGTVLFFLLIKEL